MSKNEKLFYLNAQKVFVQLKNFASKNTIIFTRAKLFLFILQ